MSIDSKAENYIRWVNKLTNSDGIKKWQKKEKEKERNLKEKKSQGQEKNQKKIRRRSKNLQRRKNFSKKSPKETEDSDGNLYLKFLKGSKQAMNKSQYEK